MKKHHEPTLTQKNTLAQLLSIVEERTGKRTETTLELLRTAGFTPYWRRVVWNGGVGSYHWMPRRNKYRVLVAATKSGLTSSHVREIPIVPGIVDTILISGHRHGFRYGWCVEC